MDKTVNGKNMPCNAEKTTIVTESGETIVGHIPHWSTCPQFKNFKRGSDLVPGGDKNG